MNLIPKRRSNGALFKRASSPMQARGGFTLLEMSVVLGIIALILAGGLATFMKYTEKKAYELTEQRLINLQEALLAYRHTHGRLPCPADITDTVSDANFGQEHGDIGVCEGGNHLQYTTDNDVVGGLLPVRALGLPDDYAFDSWGSRLFYAVDRRFTALNSFTILHKDSDGKLEVRQYLTATNRHDSSAVYIILSHGANRHGAYPRSGDIYRVTGRSTSAVKDSSDYYWDYELENCDCDEATAASATFNEVFTQVPFKQSVIDANDLFDDILVFSTRAQLE